MTCHFTLSLCKNQIGGHINTFLRIYVRWVNSKYSRQKACIPAACRWKKGPEGGRVHRHSAPEDRRAPNSSQRPVMLVKELAVHFAQHLRLTLSTLRARQKDMNDGTQPVVWDVIERHKHRTGDLLGQPVIGEEFPLERRTCVSQDVETWRWKRRRVRSNEYLQQQCFLTTTKTNLTSSHTNCWKMTAFAPGCFVTQEHHGAPKLVETNLERFHVQLD